MNDFETKLRASLDSAGQRAPVPSPLEGATMKRIRVRRGIQAAALGVAALLAVAGVATAIRLGDRNDPPPANHSENLGPYTRWLYAVDSNDLSAPYQVLAVDPDTRRVVRSYSTDGFDPQAASSPDGSRLYVMSSRTPVGVDSFENVIDTYDTSSGRRLGRATLPELDGATKNRTMHKLPLATPDFVASSDGGRLYLAEVPVHRGPARRDVSIGTFDVRTNQLSANSVTLPDCVTRVLLPGADPDQLTVVCSASLRCCPVDPWESSVYFVTIGDDGSALSKRRIFLPNTPNGAGAGLTRLAWAAGSPDLELVYAVTRDGQVSIIDVAKRQVVGRERLEIPAGSTVQQQKVLLTADGRTLYVGTGPATTVTDANAINAFDAFSFRLKGSVDAGDYFWTLALGPGDTRLYAPSFDKPNWKIQVFDAATLEELDPITSAGHSPSIIEVPRLGR